MEQNTVNVDPLNARLDVNLRVRDLEASITWYSEVFGTEPIYRGVDRSLDGEAVQMACFRLGKVKLWLLPSDGSEGDTAQPQRPQRIGLAFMTPQPLAPLRRELEARGARFDDGELPRFPAGDDGVRRGWDAEFLYVLDPDGHRLEFSRVYGLAGAGDG